MKTCKGCSESKDISEFSKHSQMRDGHLNYCKLCVYRRTRARAEGDPERHRAIKRAERIRNRDAYTARRQEWRHKNADRHRANNRAWYEANKERIRARDKERRERHPEDTYADYRRRLLRRKYGLTVERYEELLAAQSGCCAVCGSKEPRGNTRAGKAVFVVDHDHNTGAVRGLLCRTCNAAIGLLGDNPENLRRALRYLTAAPLLAILPKAG
jgi:hypothetical protein